MSQRVDRSSKREWNELQKRWNRIVGVIVIVLVILFLVGVIKL